MIVVILRVDCVIVDICDVCMFGVDVGVVGIDVDCNGCVDVVDVVDVSICIVNVVVVVGVVCVVVVVVFDCCY